MLPLFPDAVVLIALIHPARQDMGLHGENQQEQRQQNQQVAAQTPDNKRDNKRRDRVSTLRQRGDALCHGRQNGDAADQGEQNAQDSEQFACPAWHPHQPFQQQQKEQPHFHPVNQIRRDAGNQRQHCRRDQGQFGVPVSEQKAETTQQDAGDHGCPVVPVVGVVGHRDQRIYGVQRH